MVPPYIGHTFSKFWVIWVLVSLVSMFLAKSSLRGRRPLAKTLKLAVWAFSLIFLLDSTLFVMDIHQNMPISQFSTPFDHFQILPTLAVNPNLILEPCHILYFKFWYLLQNLTFHWKDFKRIEKVWMSYFMEIVTFHWKDLRR